MSEIKVDTVAEKTSANGVTIDGLNIKDSKLVTANSVITSNVTDANITYGKIQNVTATNRILGRDSANAGIIEEITPANLRTMLNVADGANVGGGKILQAVSNSTSSETTNASTNYASSGLAVAITPSASSSKILVLVGSNLRIAGDGGASNTARQGKIAIFRGGVSGTLLQQQVIGIINISATSSSGVQSVNSISFAYLDSPSTTNATTYEIGISGDANGDAQAQPFNFGSSIVLLEVGA